jgi:hypothetical protein
MRARLATSLLLATALAGAGAPLAAFETRWSGLLDLRLVHSDAGRSWLDAGLDKQRFADSDGPLALGAAILDLRARFGELFGAHLTLAAYDGLGTPVDLTEAFLDFHPVPRSAWRLRARAGAFYPPVSLENSGPGWTSPYTLSFSAIDTWIGEEIRALGGEVELTRSGRFSGSPHDFGVTAAFFRQNDPAGALLSWRGWALHDRQTGLFEKLPLADLPAFGERGSFPPQAAFEKPYVELDGRAGWYADAHWSFADATRVRFLRYDNRGNPAIVRHGQWAWRTRFDHLGWQLRLPGDADLLVQALAGDTEMDGYTGPLVYAKFRAGYLMASRAWGAHRASLRFDAFDVRDDDPTPDDPNAERGHAWTVAYFYTPPAPPAWRLPGSWRAGLEVLSVRSHRPARAILGDPVDRRETSAQLTLQWRF